MRNIDHSGPWSIPADLQRRLAEARHKQRLRAYPQLLLRAAVLPHDERRELLQQRFDGILLCLADQFIKHIAELPDYKRFAAAEEHGRNLALVALQDADPDPWLDEPWTEEEAAAIEAAESE